MDIYHPESFNDVLYDYSLHLNTQTETWNPNLKSNKLLIILYYTQFNILL